MKGTRKLFSILTALALCLGLLPGTAWAAEGDPGVSINGSSLESGKQYVAGEYGVVEKTSDTPAGTPYLDYNNNVLTVHGQMNLATGILITGDLKITGDAGSSLEVSGIILKDSTLTLDGGVDFTNNRSLNTYYSSSATVVNKLTTMADYSGGITISGSSGVLLDVQSSKSIAITGVVNDSGTPKPMDPMTLKSDGYISLTGMFQYHTVTLEGKNVSLKNGPVFWGNSLTITAGQDVTIESGTLAIMGAAEVSAGGNVTISIGSVPVQPSSGVGSLTVNGAQSVSITGKTDANNDYIAQLFPVPVTFENCGNVTVTDTGTGEILKEGVTVASDKPWTATTGGKPVTMPSGSWTYGGDITSTLNTTSGMHVINSTDPIVYDAGEGKVFYEPAAVGGTAVLTLDGASFSNELWIRPASPVQIELKGENQIKGISTGTTPLTLTGTGSFAGTLRASEFTNNSTGTLDALVGVLVPNTSVYGYTMYGERSTSDSLQNFVVSGGIPLTIAEGAVLTVAEDTELTINGPAGLTNNGAIINNGVIKINADANAGDADISAFIKGLKLTGTGNVSVKKGSGSGDADTYTNSGTKLMDPAGTLDLSSAEASDANWATQGYKWENVVKDETSGAITSAKLTLAEGFNATSVTLPDAAVTIKTEGESRVETLAISGGNPQNTELAFSGTGPLTVDERINIAGGSGNTVTVAAGAQVTANNGIYVGITGEDSITVYGTLKAKSSTDPLGSAPAISAGKVSVGTTGILEVSGEKGVDLHGVGSSGPLDFSNLFAITGDGRFTADCSEYNIFVGATNTDNYPKDDEGNVDASKVIVLSDEYMPDDCEVRLVDNDIKLWDTENNKELTGPLTIHKNHIWETTWTQGETTHWHACTFEGCTAKQPDSEAPHYYAHGAEKCRVCEYPRPDGTPDSDGGGDGGDSGGDGGDSGDSSDNGGSGGSGGGDGSSSTYAIAVKPAEHGEISSDRARAGSGRTVTLTVTPDEGYMLDTLTVTDSRGNKIELTERGGGKYTFTMPGRAVTAEAMFAPLPDDTQKPCTGGADCPSRAFSDLDTSQWYHEAVDYVLRNGLMNGYGSGLFGPNDMLSRAQFAQILYNKEGRQAVNYLLQYNDVADGAWYTEAIRWATSQGVVNGYGNGRFGPGDDITREQLAVMLWRYAGSPAASETALDFTDADKVSGWALDALRWAVEQGVIQGKGSGILDPAGQATRVETAQMLKNFMERP